MANAPEIRWLAAPLVSALHAAEALTNGRPLADERIAPALVEPVEGFAQAIVAANLPVQKFWSHLLPLAQGSASARQLAETALVKTIGQSSRVGSLSWILGGWISNIETAFSKLYPKLGKELELRGGPLREQWESRGPGFLHSVYRLTSEELAVPSADVLLLQPVLGGGGAAHLLYNSVRIEAVLANPTPELPEIVRLGWLISQLNLEVPSLGERVAAGRLPQTAELAMLPVALKAGEEVELCRFDHAGVELALAAWHVNVPENCDIVSTLFDWWETYLEARPSWPVALAALDQMIQNAP